jgi:ribosomal 50S subunit-associated protein YjgA (DUF615 family)
MTIEERLLENEQREDQAMYALEALLNSISSYPQLDRPRLRAILRAFKEYFSDTPVKNDSAEIHTTNQ